jgi:myo-inositol-1(or 4)-monophosphatase
MNLDLDLALKAAFEAAQESRKILLSYFGRLSHVSEKDQAGLVSEADVASEKMCDKVLKSYFPDFSMLGEEGVDVAVTEKALHSVNGLWVVDPLDGTTNYVHKLPIYSISIALQLNKELQVGLIDVPALKRTYYAVRGRGAFLIDEMGSNKAEPLKVSSRKKVTDCLFATGFSSHHLDSLEDQISIFSNLVRRSRGIRRAGSAAFDLCMVAEGVYDSYWEKSLKSWDMAAGALIVEEAGGIVTNYTGEHFRTFDTSIIASNRNIHQEIVDTVKKSCQKMD